MRFERNELPYTDDMQIIELDSLVTAFPVKPGDEGPVKRRFMTLFSQDGGKAHVGGTSYVCKVRSFTGETFALKRLITSGFVSDGVEVSSEDSARITKGHAEAFYEEYKSQLLVSHMRGFPKLYGYGQIGDDPVIIMEWVDGVSLREFSRQRAEEGLPIGGEIVAQIAVAVLDALYSIERLDNTLVHRDISAANIMIRTDTVSLEDQIAAGEFDICLIDLGSASSQMPDDPSFTMVSQVWRNGTPAYAPPEMLTQDMPHIDELRKSQAIDVFALCSVLYELYSGNVPWDLSARPGVSPFRVKTEDEPAPLVPKRSQDAPLVEATESGLAIEQGRRASVRELLGAMEAYLAQVGAASGRTGGSGLGPLGNEELPGAGGDGAPGPARASARARILPAGLYTPDSTRLEVARVDAGGKRAGEDVAPFEKPRGLTRRSFIAGSIALVVAALAGAGAVARFAPKPGFDFSGYPVADAAWEGGPLYPAMQLTESSWYLLDAASSARAALETDREPGRFARGLVRVHDAASDGCGFMTAVRDAAGEGLASAWRILPEYADAGDFSETDALAAVLDRESGLWGYVDKGGDMKIAPAFEQVGRFSCGYAAVRPARSQLWGVVDSSGAEVLAPRFARLGMRSDEGLMAAAGSSTSQWGFIDENGAWAVGDTFAHVRRFTEGMAACLLDAAKGLWGYIDISGKTAIPARFSEAYPFAGGLAPAKDPDTNLWGLIDIEGAWHVQPRYLSLGEKAGDLFPAHGSPINSYDVDYSSGSAWDTYWKEGNGDPYIAYGYIDTEGNWVFKPSFGDTLIRTPEQ